MPKIQKNKRKIRRLRELMSENHLPAAHSVVKNESPKLQSSGFFRLAHSRVPFVIALVVLLYIGLNVWIYFYGTKIFSFNLNLQNLFTSISVVKKQGFGQLTSTTKPVTPARKIYPLPTGTQSWTFSHGPGVTGPKIQTATVDPLTPTKGGTQTVTITATHTVPVTGVTATEFTDNQKTEHTLKLTTGTAADGTWSASWRMNDTYEHTYHIDFVLTSSKGNWSGALTFR